MSLLACIRASAASRSVFIVEHKYVVRIVLKDRSGVAVDTSIVDGNNCDQVGIKVRISVLETVSVSVTSFSSAQWDHFVCHLKIHCQSLSSLRDRFCRFHEAYLVLHCWKHSALLEQYNVLRKDFLVTEARHLVLVRGDRRKKYTALCQYISF